MKRYALLLLLLITLISSAPAAEPAGANNAPEKIFTPVEGVKQFTVTGRGSKFRLSVMAIGGGSISAPRIKGKAKHVSTAQIERVDKDGQPLIGAIEQEFVFQGTGAGDVTIEFTLKNPAEPMPVIESYTITIK